MKTLLTTSFAILGLLAPAAQAQFLYDVNGRVINEMEYTNVEGSPYLYDTWYSGLVKDTKGKVHDGIKIRYDAYTDEVEYEKAGKLYRLGPEITEFSIPTGTSLYSFKKGFPAVGNHTEKNFYRVLYDGNTKLLKRYSAKKREERAYNSATITQRFELAEEMFVLKNGTMHPIKRNDKKGLLKILSDEKNLMEFAIKEQQLNFKTEDDIVKLLEEYDAYKAGRKSKS